MTEQKVQPSAQRPDVVVITKLTTTNLGNQALSTELMRLAVRHFRTGVTVIGRPAGLDAYSSARLRRFGGRHIDVFEAWADRVAQGASRANGSGPLPMKQLQPTVRLVSPDSAPARQEGLRLLGKRARAWAMRFLPYRGVYQSRLTLLARAGTVIYSGAGEVADTDVYVRQLVELRVAQKLGCRTMAINQSIVLHDPLFRELLGHVYSRMHRIVVRGMHSRAALCDLGVPKDLIDTAPDTAFLTAAPSPERTARLLSEGGIAPGTVGLAVTPQAAEDMHTWEQIVGHLRRLGHDVVFVSNEPNRDRFVAARFRDRLGVRHIGKQSHYEEYAGLLGGLDFVISGRLHTNVLALIAGTPVIPIEGRQHKTREVFESFDYPIPVISAGANGWVDSLMTAVGTVRSQRDQLRRFMSAALPGIRRAVERNLAIA